MDSRKKNNFMYFLGWISIVIIIGIGGFFFTLGINYYMYNQQVNHDIININNEPVQQSYYIDMNAAGKYCGIIVDENNSSLQQLNIESIRFDYVKRVFHLKCKDGSIVTFEKLTYK